MITIDLQNTGVDTLAEDTAEKIEKSYIDLCNAKDGGFQKILEPGTPEAPNLHILNELVGRYKLGSTGKPINTFVLLGMGGSSLGGETLISALSKSTVKFYFPENVDPEFFQSNFNQWNPETTLFYAVSKSGKTLETISQLMACWEWAKGVDRTKHFVVCTEPNEGDLRKFAEYHSLTIIDHPVKVGGRFVVFTPVGLFPAMFAGIDAEKLLEGARFCRYQDLKAINKPTLQTAYALHQLHDSHPITVSMPYCDGLQPFTRWFCQIWAESLGKNGKGFTPYAARGTTDQHSQVQLYMEGPQDKVINFIEIGRPMLPLKMPEHCEQLPNFMLLKNKSMNDLLKAELDATRDSCTSAKIPNFTIRMDELNEQNLGALLYFWESVTVYSGGFLNVYPFDQPGVEQGKRLTKEYLA